MQQMYQCANPLWAGPQPTDVSLSINITTFPAPNNSGLFPHWTGMTWEPVDLARSFDMIFTEEPHIWHMETKVFLLLRSNMFLKPQANPKYMYI